MAIGTVGCCISTTATVVLPFIINHTFPTLHSIISTVLVVSSITVQSTVSSSIFIHDLLELPSILQQWVNLSTSLFILYLKQEDGSVSLTQTGLIDRIIKALNLESATPRQTPAMKTPLGQDKEGSAFSQEFNYASVVGMMLYLCNNSRPDITFAVSQCARYSHNPTSKHAKFLQLIGRYLKGTRDKGLILRPQSSNPLDIKCYVDADFAGLYKQEDPNDPHSVKSRSGWVILIGGCPIVWKSKLISEICLSTMESEYISLSKACRDLLPIQRVVAQLGVALGLPEGDLPNIQSTIWEDNEAALKLANKELPYMTTRSKHIAIKYHWFRSHVNKDWKVCKVDTTDQLADIFTKGLDYQQFVSLRQRIMGW